MNAGENGATETERGLGLAAALPRKVIEAAADATAGSRYHSFWLNNPPHASALPVLGDIARRHEALTVGVGVIPLSHHSPDEIAQEVRTNRVPLARLYLGVGNGGGGGGVDRVRKGIDALRESLDTTIVIAAMGPRMCRLAGEAADGVLFNWLTPEYAKRSAEWVREAAAAAGKPAPRLMAYVRVALGEGAAERLSEEAGRYEAIPQYAAHFKRMGVPAIGTAIAATTPDALTALDAWNGVVDEIVVRAITAHDTEAEVVRLVEAAAPV